jgi:hypothetical protein
VIHPLYERYGDTLDASAAMLVDPTWYKQQFEQASVPPPPSRTKWTRRVPHPVLIGHSTSSSSSRRASLALRRPLVLHPHSPRSVPHAKGRGARGPAYPRASPAGYRRPLRRQVGRVCDNIL